MKKFEYKIIYLSSIGNTIKGQEKILNEFGSQGWEIVSISSIDPGVTYSGAACIYLKREMKLKKNLLQKRNHAKN